MSPASKVAADNKCKPFTPRPPRSATERLPMLYRALTDQVDDGYFQNAIKTCKKILTLDSTSTSAFQTLLYFNLHTDQYQAALDLLSNPPSSSPLDFEKAYCLYRLHREKEALVLLEALADRGRKEQHLEAQIVSDDSSEGMPVGSCLLGAVMFTSYAKWRQRYRLGEYDKAQELYDDLLAGGDPSSPEHPDILTNLSATGAHTDFLSHTYHSFLNVPPPASSASGPTGHVPSAGNLESYVPSLPTGWAAGGVAGVKKAASVKEEKKETAKGKIRHSLPKGAMAGKPFTQDPDRWLPLRQRSSFIAAMGKKKGANLSMGAGMTQGSKSTTAAPSDGGGGSGGGKTKKGKKK